jgi:glutathione S-transferase
MTMILFHSPHSRSMRVLWTLEELGAPYQLKTLPFPPRVFDPSYLEINPLGTVPLLIDGDTRMTESSAACQYLAARYGAHLGVAADDPAFGAYLQWLSFGEATLSFPLAIMLRYTQLEPDPRKLPQAVEDYRRFFRGRVRDGLLSALRASPYVCGERFTVADVSVGYALHLARFVGAFDDLDDVAKSYYQRLADRPAFQKATSDGAGFG